MPRKRSKAKPARRRRPQWSDDDLRPLVAARLAHRDEHALRAALLERVGRRHALEVMKRTEALWDEQWEGLPPARRATWRREREAMAKRSQIEQERARRGDVAAAWIERYGVPIADRLLVMHLSIHDAHESQVERAERALLADLRALLVKQRAERQRLLRRDVPGTSGTSWVAVAPRARRPGAFRSTFGDRLVAFERAARDLRRFVDLRIEWVGPLEKRGTRGRAADADLTRAAQWAYAWVTERAPNVSKAKRLADVRTALVFHGWDLRGPAAENLLRALNARIVPPKERSGRKSS